MALTRGEAGFTSSRIETSPPRQARLDGRVGGQAWGLTSVTTGPFMTLAATAPTNAACSTFAGRGDVELT
ncbi:MAG: hypothetical protein HYR85_23825 [Planctomycetes bacterium]|nr:hypothetical protein [Planctomycetota bacterium]MBI3847204.1 hypothetical protein [Planctomycetota bacterium]